MTDFHTRYRAIIDIYRNALLGVDPDLCARIDAKMVEKGQGWVADSNEAIDLDRYMTATEIAKEFFFSAQNVRDWARNNPDKIKKHKVGGSTLYHLREVVAYHASRG